MSNFEHTVYMYWVNWVNNHLQINLESLGNALHKKDYYGKEAISEPQVWSSFQTKKEEKFPFPITKEMLYKILGRCGQH